jgi:hypothetical protein
LSNYQVKENYFCHEDFTICKRGIRLGEENFDIKFKKVVFSSKSHILHLKGQISIRGQGSPDTQWYSADAVEENSFKIKPIANSLTNSKGRF